jgi:hypothetical protein
MHPYAAVRSALRTIYTVYVLNGGKSTANGFTCNFSTREPFPSALPSLPSFPCPTLSTQLPPTHHNLHRQTKLACCRPGPPLLASPAASMARQPWFFLGVASLEAACGWTRPARPGRCKELRHRRAVPILLVSQLGPPCPHPA